MADNPIAGVSGPGSYSKRTDIGTPEMKMGSIAYGEGVETQAIKSGAPLAKAPDTRPAPISEITESVSATPLTPLYADTQRPGESIMAGVDRGDGPGSEVLMMRRGTERLSDILVKMLPYDTDGSINILYQEALARGN